MSSMNGRHALVTGASGFIGANLVRALLHRGCAVTALVRASSDLWRLRGVVDRVELCRVDLADAASLAALADSATADLVFHLAAGGVRPGQPPVAVLDANLLGTVNLLGLLAARGDVARLVFASSCSVYGAAAGAAEDAPLRGADVYALSKIAGEAICRSYAATGRMPAVVLRLYTPYGPYEASYRFVAGTMLKAVQGADLPLTGGAQARDFVFIDDATEALIAAALAPDVVGEAVNVCTGVSTSIREGVEAILAAVGSRSVPQFGALPYRDNEVWEMSGDPHKMQTRLAVPPPRPFRAGVALTRDWLMQNLDLYERENR